MNTILLVGIGGFLGAISRVWVSKQVNSRFETDFPVGTLTVNLVGAFLLGVIISSHSLESWELFLGTGFMGAFTTFSTFKLENILLHLDKKRSIAVRYLLISYGGGLLLAWIGILIGQR